MRVKATVPSSPAPKARSTPAESSAPGRSPSSRPATSPALPAWATNLQEAFDAAQRQDPTVQAARLQVDIDNQQRKAARSRLRPSLGAELSTTNGQLHTNLFSRHYYDNRLAGINLSIPVYSPQDAARLQQAQVAELLAQSRLAQALQSLAEQVVSSYFAVLSAQDALDVVEAQRSAYIEELAKKQNTTTEKTPRGATTSAAWVKTSSDTEPVPSARR